MPDSWAIILLLVHERAQGSDSFWFPYIDMLPKGFDNALFFTEEEASVLEGTTLADKLRDANRDLAEIGEKLAEMRSRNPDGFPEDTFNHMTIRWAYSVYWSRALVVPLDSNGKPDAHNHALCPYLDLLNHCPRSAHSLSSWIASSSESTSPPVTQVRLVAGSKVAPGSEVVINYGRKSNEQLLLYYGFAARNNAADSVQFTVSLAKATDERTSQETRVPSPRLSPHLRLWRGGPTGAVFDAAREAARVSSCPADDPSLNPPAEGDSDEKNKDDDKTALLSQTYSVEDLAWSDPRVILLGGEDVGGGAGEGCDGPGAVSSCSDDSAWLASVDLGHPAPPLLEKQALLLLQQVRSRGARAPSIGCALCRHKAWAAPCAGT